MEGADQVLALRRIDAGLAADRGIDLRQQRRRHLHVIEPAPHARRGKAGEIADHAAAERDDEIAALDARRDDLLAHLLERRDSSWSLRRPAPRCARARCRPPSARLPPRRDDAARPSSSVTIAHLAPGRSALMRAPSARQQPAPDRDVVGALAERDRAPRSARPERSGAVMTAAPRCRRPRCLAAARDDLVDDGVVRLVARLHHDVGLRIDRIALSGSSVLRSSS